MLTRRTLIMSALCSPLVAMAKSLRKLFERKPALPLREEFAEVFAMTADDPVVQHGINKIDKMLSDPRRIRTLQRCEEELFSKAISQSGVNPLDREIDCPWSTPPGGYQI